MSYNIKRSDNLIDRWVMSELGSSAPFSYTPANSQYTPPALDKADSEKVPNAKVENDQQPKSRTENLIEISKTINRTAGLLVASNKFESDLALMTPTSSSGQAPVVEKKRGFLARLKQKLTPGRSSQTEKAKNIASSAQLGKMNPLLLIWKRLRQEERFFC